MVSASGREGGKDTKFGLDQDRESVLGDPENLGPKLRCTEESEWTTLSSTRPRQRQDGDRRGQD